MRNMMKTRYKQLFACVAALLLAISVPAQDLPLLPADPAVKQGVLPNGMTYYLSNNINNDYEVNPVTTYCKAEIVTYLSPSTSVGITKSPS